ncbi:MAG: putative selenate ABC transporter substrate-binding protein [Gammaproteobacteria bacterium RIFCSPLOWO2_12_FULL_52_10]|nr:MAG: putative selenate ABC transporter substrate-binding protein [Gammaproteobacteria bacterium RIFCSPLOWO2_12_FULL_52_10]
MHAIRLILCTALVMLSLSAGAQTGAAARTLRFTAIPDQNTTELTEKFQPLADYLGKQLGIKVEYVAARDYQATVEMFRNGDVQLAWFGGLTSVQARKAVPGARAIAQGEEDPKYFSYFIAHKDTGLTESASFPQAIALLSFTFGSESSTSGRLMPEYFIRQNTGKGPMEFFQQPIGFSGSHDKTAELVEAGRFQVGVLNYKVYEKRVAAGTTDPDVVRIIWKTPTFADYNWTVHPTADELLGAGFIDKLQKALVSIDNPDLLTALPRNRLIPATNEEYEELRAVAEALGMVR